MRKSRKLKGTKPEKGQNQKSRISEKVGNKKNIEKKEVKKIRSKNQIKKVKK